MDINKEDKAGNKIGLWNHYYLDGSLASSGYYEDDNRVGVWILYYDDWNIWAKGCYNNNGDMDGYWEEYKSKGTIIISKEYHIN